MNEENKLWAQNNDTFWLRSLGIIHQALPAQVYRLDVDQYSNIFLTGLLPKFSFDYKVYGLEKDLISRVVKTSKEVGGNLGILLNGQRGTGKTVTAKILGNSLNLPVIVIDKMIDEGHNFLNSIPQDIVIFIDEYEKIFEETHQLLSIMDGALNSEHKRIFILTTNDLYVNDNLIQRPGRIRYLKTFGDLSKDAISEIVDDILINQKYKDSILKFISKLEMITVDIVKTVCQEVNVHNEFPESFENVFNVKKVSGKFDVYLIDEKSGRRLSELPVMSGVRSNLRDELELGNGFYLSDKYIGVLEEKITDSMLKIKMNFDYDDELNSVQKKILKSFPIQRKVKTRNEIGVPKKARSSSKEVAKSSRARLNREETIIILELVESEAFHRMFRWPMY